MRRLSQNLGYITLMSAERSVKYWLVLSQYRKDFKEETFTDFAVLGVASKNFILEIFRPPYLDLHVLDL